MKKLFLHWRWGARVECYARTSGCSYFQWSESQSFTKFI